MKKVCCANCADVCKGKVLGCSGYIPVDGTQTFRNRVEAIMNSDKYDKLEVIARLLKERNK